MILSSSIIYLRSNVRVYRHRIMSLCWKIRSKIKHLIHKPLPKPSERTRKKSFFTLKMPEKGKIKPSKRFYPFLPRSNFFLSVTAFQTFLRRFKVVAEVRLTGEVFWGYSINYGTRKEHHSSEEKHQLPPIWNPVCGSPTTQFWPLKKIKRTAVNVGSLTLYTIRK